ncbi:DUF4352 domain-containing protein [Exiguobacterium sp. B2(2022)]|uniref:DUF4352 domain-containing protein n=1 Tax=Exiguobacterium sp. B2(2022) TaxID=2992755 RepID=UPI00237B5217|nr:DUF4352 domain-containing protein [Exiguobacterium sp. B2(2022)]MDE0564757.1 DUF4352 domain-containing protein [Exiguobacterium sp. B2(2022)]
MKVRHWLFTLPLVFLIGCGETDEATSSETIEQTEQTTDEEATSSSEGSESSKDEDTSEGIGGSEEFEVEENELGISQIYMKNRNLGIEEKIGPIIFQIDKVQTLRLQVASDFRFMFDEKKEVTIVSFNVIVENTSDDTVSFHPNQARLVTNTGEQVDADLIISEDVGGEFLGKVKKEGGVLFHVDSMPAELTEVRFVVEGPYNDQFNTIAEDRYEYTIDVSK